MSPLASRLLRSMPLVLALALGGCPRPPPLDFGAQGRLTDPQIAFDAVLARRAAIHSVRGEARAALQTPEGSGKLTQYVAAQSPDSLRLESISFFGNPLAVLTSDGERFQLHDLEQGRFHEGPATAQNVSQLLPLVVPPDELVSLILGVPPLPGAARSLEVDDKRRAYVLTLRPDTQTLGLDTRTLRPLFLTMPARPGLSAYRAEFADYRDVDGLDLPKTVRLFSADGRTKIELSWREREVNAPIPPAAFTQRSPPGAELSSF